MSLTSTCPVNPGSKLSQVGVSLGILDWKTGVGKIQPNLATAAPTVPLAIARAYYVAMMPPRGPVLVSIPADDWTVLTAPIVPRQVSAHLRPEPTLLAEMGDALDASRHPAIVIGAAVDRDGAWDSAVQLAERHNARVYVAPMSGRCGFPEDHRLFAGFLPAMRERIVERLAGHDLILVVGAPAFTYHVEGEGPHVPEGATLYQLIDDPDIAAWTPTGTSVVGSIRLSLLDLLERKPPASRPLPAPRAAQPPVALPAVGERMSVAYVLKVLNELRAPSCIVVEEAPSSRPEMQAHLPIYHSETFYTMCSGGLGHGVPAAVGVALAKPGARVIGLIGDGSAMYSIQALWSAAQLKLPIIFVILKNRRYAALQEFATAFGFQAEDKPEGTELPDLDFTALAAGMAVKAVRVERVELLRDALAEALRTTVPILVEVEVA